MNNTPLNPDALEAMSRVMNPPAWSVIERYPEDELVIMTKEAELSKAEKLARAYVAVAQPEPTPDQRMELGELLGRALRQCGISMTYALSGPGELYDVAGIVLREYPNLAVSHPVVNSVEELDALPLGTIIEDSDDDCVLQALERGSIMGTEWYIPGVEKIFTSKDVELPARVLWSPEVNNGL